MKITKKLIEDLVREMILEEVTPKKAIEKEGGAIGLDMLADMTGMSKEELRDLIDKDPDLKKHKDGDIIDASGLQEDLVITEEDIDEILTGYSQRAYHEKEAAKAADRHAASKPKPKPKKERRNPFNSPIARALQKASSQGLDFDKLGKMFDKGLKADGGVRFDRD